MTKKFATPTGEIIQAQKYGVLNLRLNSSQGSLLLGRCRVFLMSGDWKEFLIGENMLQYFGIPPKIIAAEK